MQGNEACAYAAVVAGCRFFAGYPITPSSEIFEVMARELPRVGGVCIQMEDEIASIMAAIGASWAGLKSMTATSGPGIALMAEAVGYAAMTETPLVIVDVQRAGPATGVPTKPSQGDIMEIRWLSNGDYEIVAMYPWSVQEVVDLTIRAFNLAEEFRVPTILLMDGTLAHLHEKVAIPSEDDVRLVNRPKPSSPPEEYMPYKPSSYLVPPMASFGDGYRTRCEGLAHDYQGMPTSSPDVYEELVRRLCDKIRLNSHRIAQLKYYFLDDAEVAILAYGTMARIMYAAIRELRDEGERIGLIRPITIWPLPEELSDLMSEMKKVLVVEMNYGQLVREIERLTDRKRVVFCPWLRLEFPCLEEAKAMIRRHLHAG
ncbi:MAG: 2-oxoacid:acceptor oxidoreductase subunit alpha [Thermoprotei archaeon]|nr:MAG: 2-oxoacid:acceptor oxidoreductase subunit alpha [Thermoprotei archaeon]RLF23750.1 MAG: 2-oxoacid:acceptor oxidoreductase subunit alpha [Thermoprotei archaeon]